MDAEAQVRKQKHVAEEYHSSLSDLQCNSKPLINMLTMLAEENIDHAPIIVKVVEQHIAKVPTDLKLPILYLIDSIVKNVKKSYIALFSQCIVNIFCDAFEKVNEKIRERMYALRQTWNEVFPPNKLYALDVRVKQMDKNWPITASVKQHPTAIHVNPNFLKTVPKTAMTSDMEEILQAKTRELLELKKRKLELELEATKKHIEEQQKQLAKTTDGGSSLIDTHVDPSLLASLDVPGTSTQASQLLQPATNAPAALIANRAPTAIMAGNGVIFGAHNYVRPVARSATHVMPQTSIMQMQGQQPNMNKVKVHPVNPALCNSIRHRDPRLMRQQLQQQQHIVPHNVTAVAHPQQMSLDASNVTTVVDTKQGKRDSFRSSKSRKSLSNQSSSAIRSTHRSGKSSSGASLSSRDRDRDRKRGGEERRSTKNVSSGSSSSSSSRDKHSKAMTKDSNELPSIAIAANQSKQSNKSPSSSPTKSKDISKRSHNKSRSSSSNSPSQKNGLLRRSSSNEDIVSSTKDLDLRSTMTADSSGNESHGNIVDASTTKELIKKPSVKVIEQNIEKDHEHMTITTTPPTIQDIDLRQLLPAVIQSIPAVPSQLRQPISQPLTTAPLISSVEKLALNESSSINSTTTTNTRLDKKTDVGKAKATTSILVASSSSTNSPPQPKVSFKIQKIFNKLAKSTETLSTATTSSTSSSSAIATESKIDLEDSRASTSVSAAAKIASKIDISQTTSTTEPMDIDGDNDKDNSDDIRKSVPTGDGKKRVSASAVCDEPMAKKSKSSKMDALFGSEDVDYRTLAPQPMPVTVANDVLVAPSPPTISTTDDQEAMKNSEIATQSKPPTSSSFEDVRAKFAKATRIDRLSKAEKTPKDPTSRSKSSELNTMEDETTQEANDEKIRIILTQAQEMLESNSLNQGQYKQLVQTVMSINENNKLKEAKRRESLQLKSVGKTSTKDTAVTQQSTEDDANSAVDAELMAAREAVLRKRIPKLSKNKTVTNINTNTTEERMRTQSPIGETDDAQDNVIGRLNKLKPKEKRVRNSKWGDRNDNNNQGGGGAGTGSNHQQQQSGNAAQRPWPIGVGGKRGRGGGPIPPPPQAPPPPLLLGPNALRPMQGDWPSAAPYNNQMPTIRGCVPPPPQPPMNMPPVLPILTPGGLPKPCNSIDNPQAELVRSITIDGQSKDIRVYDEVAIVFMDIDEPREIGFQSGQRAIIIDNQEPVALRFNDEYRPLMIAGEPHRVRFGFPSRELYIDEHWYEIYFGGPPVSIPINNRIHVLKAEGPPPQVNIGPLRRDLVVGKIHMIVEAVNLFPLFLDARVQKFRYNDMEHTVQFADNLLTLLLDGQPVQVEYGGLPKGYNLSGKRYFIRFTTLPKGVVAGKVQIKDMIYVKTERPTEKPLDTAPETPEIIEVDKNDNDQPKIENQPPEDANAATASVPLLPTAALGKINIDELFQKLVSTGILNNNTTNKILPTPASGGGEPLSSTEVKPETKPDVEQPTTKEEEPVPLVIEPIDLSNSESIKTRQEAIIATLYSGMQCSSCGVRFPPEQTIKYSQHLDWHFRQNRRESDSNRKSHSRKWFYDLNDWLQYEEIEDLEEREKNFFETQQNELDIINDESNQRSTNSIIPSCPAGADDVDRTCDMCQEKFEQFYNEELEEWHLRAALRIDDNIYHPLCYEDYKASLNPPVEQLATTTKPIEEDDNAVDVVIKIEEDDKGSEGDQLTSPLTIPEDDDDDVIVLPNEEPSVTEIDDDEEEYVPLNVTREEMGIGKSSNSVGEATEKEQESAMESDVEIQEPNIPFTDLDTYEEKELPVSDEVAQTFLSTKIKEEPRDDDEDDGFEEVGTVMYGPHDEISIQSSEETQTQTIVSSVDSPVAIGGERSSSANLFNPTPSDTAVGQLANNDDSIAIVNEDSNNIAFDGNVEPADGHNLSTAGPSPAIPLGSLVNKIKINITKNIITGHAAANNASSSSSATAVNSTTATSEMAATATNSASLNNNNTPEPCNLNINTIVSTIPVLCGGGTVTSSNIVNNNVSSITVIGSSYGSSYEQQKQQQQPMTASTSTTGVAATTAAIAATPSKPLTPPPPIEETITYEVKPALQKAALKKMKKVDCGVETSGLCSIM